MRHILSASIFALSIASAVVASAVVAQGYAPSLTAGPTAEHNQLAKAFIPGRLRSQTLASDLIGTKVYALSGEAFGQVDDLLFDDSGNLAGLVVNTSGILGIGGKSIGVPFDRVDVEKDRSGSIIGVRLELTRAALDVAPPFRDRLGMPDKTGSRRMTTDSAMR
jgi:sporulation protein YlmC with PRC-barrel domain